MIRILLVDDQKMILETLKAWLEPEADFEIIGTAEDGIAAVEQVEKLKPDIVLMNIEMPVLDGASATQFITKRFNDTKVLILSSNDSDEYIAQSLSGGAKGYLLKDTKSQDIAAAIRSVYRGYTQIGPGLLEKLLIQTDSGLILSKLKSYTGEQKSISDDNPTISIEKTSKKQKFVDRSTKAISNLQSSSRKHSIELKKLHSSVEQIQPEVSRIKHIFARYSRQIWLTWILFSASIPIIYFILFNLHIRARNLEKNIIPIERIGLHGESDLNGLAQRVATSFKKDFILSDVSTVYVAQNGSIIVLKGAIANSRMLQRMTDIAKDVKGVTEVDTSQINIISSEAVQPSPQLSPN